MPQLQMFGAVSTPIDPINQQKKLPQLSPASNSQTRGSTVNIYSSSSSSTPAPYGLCRCGSEIAIPGLDAHLCPRCGWVSRLGGGQ
jgi:hypothetical protein